MVTPLEVAARYIGKFEASRNQSKEIETFWPDTDYPQGFANREPYCAAFVCHCLAQAAREGWQHEVAELPKEASVHNLLNWAKGRTGVKVFQHDPRGLKASPGDIAIFLPRLSHTGFVEEFLPDTGRILTIEANTGSAGERDGEGIYRKTRSASFAGSYIRFL